MSPPTIQTKASYSSSRNSVLPASGAPSAARANGDSNMKELRADIEDWFRNDQADWDTFVKQEPGRKLPGGQDLWDGMPAIDSKAVARTSPIFERHFGIPLDEKLIRAGGYNSVPDMLDDLIPKMQQKAAKK